MLNFLEFCDSARVAVPSLAIRWLNDRQEAAVSAGPSPPVFIVAGPGTGKTTVLALRALKLILVDGLEPHSVIATTFTRKAAAELRSRILSWGYATIQEAVRRAQLLGDQEQLAWLDSLDINAVETGTLDGIAEQMLADDRQPGEITPAVVEGFLAKGLLRRHVMFATQHHRNQVLEAHLGGFNPQFPGVRGFSEKLKTCHNFAQRVLHDRLELDLYAHSSVGHDSLARVVREYHTYLRDSNLIDFALLESDILDRLIQNRLTSWTHRLRALLVDEFQDTNHLQELIYYELCRRSGAALTVVGDDDQSIYRFRGATVEIFANFTNRIVTHLGFIWQPVRVDLVKNYRSSKPIVDLFNHFIAADPDYQQARVPGKFACSASATFAADPSRNIPVLGMFRHDMETLGTDMCAMMLQIFRGVGFRVPVANGNSFIIQRPSGGDFADSVYLAWKISEYNSGGKQRLPLLIREEMRANGVQVFNPRGRSLGTIPEVATCLGLMLECIDPQARVQSSISTMGRRAVPSLNNWRDTGRQFAASNPPPGGLQQFLADWGRRVPRNMQKWPSEWPLLELLFTVITWIPFLQDNPEGQVYLEAIARTIAEASRIGTYNSSILHKTAYDDGSVREAIREIFEAIAEENADVNEDIMPYVPRNCFPLMTIHQAKGLEFPLVVVDVGSDFRGNYAAQRRFRYPDDGDNVHFTEDHVASFTAVGPARLARSAQKRAFDDVRRLLYVAKSRAENVLILVGLTTMLRAQTPIMSIGVGDCFAGNRCYQFVPSEQWTPGTSPECIALI